MGKQSTGSLRGGFRRCPERHLESPEWVLEPTVPAHLSGIRSFICDSRAAIHQRHLYRPHAHRRFQLRGRVYVFAVVDNPDDPKAWPLSILTSKFEDRPQFSRLVTFLLSRGHGST